MWEGLDGAAGNLDEAALGTVSTTESMSDC